MKYGGQGSQPRALGGLSSHTLENTDGIRSVATAALCRELMSGRLQPKKKYQEQVPKGAVKAWCTERSHQKDRTRGLMRLLSTTGHAGLKRIQEPCRNTQSVGLALTECHWSQKQ
jgi:hypothetical protein